MQASKHSGRLLEGEGGRHGRLRHLSGYDGVGNLGLVRVAWVSWGGTYQQQV